MKIMIVTDQYPPMLGGVPTVTHGLAIDFAKRGHQVWVVAPNFGSRNVTRVEDDVQVSRFSSFEWPTYKELRIPFLPFAPIRSIIKKMDPDIIHIHAPVVLGNIAQMLAGSARKPVVYTNHYLPVNIGRAAMNDPVMGKYINNISYTYLVSFCNRCEYVTAPTQTALDLLYQHGLRVPARAISNGIDLKHYQPGPADLTILDYFGIPRDKKLVLHVNRLSVEKRIDVLLDAVPLMKSDAHIALSGSGPQEAVLRAQAERLGIADRVHFLGYVRSEDVLTLRRTADVFAIPSEADLQSLSTMEAMACGLPVVAANAYALPELVHHGENGYLHQPGESRELAGYLDEILLNDELRQKMSEASLKIIAGHDRELVLDQWEELYQRLASELKERRESRRNVRSMRKLAARSHRHSITFIQHTQQRPMTGK